MAIVIRPKFTKEDIRKIAAAKAELIRNAIFQRLQFIGEHFIIDVRSTDTYKDRTGNLRSSTGYVILYNGQQIFGGGFEIVVGPDKANILETTKEQLKKTKSKKTKAALTAQIKNIEQEGTETGKKFIEEISARFPVGFVLVGVAGMSYAAAVEARGLDVITSGSLVASASLKKAFERIKKKTA
jgi:hypothetical protein